MKLEIDKILYLMGDEEGGVSVQCSLCDRGGLPIVYYTHPGDDVYKDADVVVVYQISDMFTPATKHIARHRASTTASPA